MPELDFDWSALPVQLELTGVVRTHDKAFEGNVGPYAVSGSLRRNALDLAVAFSAAAPFDTVCAPSPDALLDQVESGSSAFDERVLVRAADWNRAATRELLTHRRVREAFEALVGLGGEATSTHARATVPMNLSQVRRSLRAQLEVAQALALVAIPRYRVDLDARLFTPLPGNGIPISELAQMFALAGSVLAGSSNWTLDVRTRAGARHRLWTDSDEAVVRLARLLTNRYGFPALSFSRGIRGWFGLPPR